MPASLRMTLELTKKDSRDRVSFGIYETHETTKIRAPELRSWLRVEQLYATPFN
jgi:hypothetical protein